MCGHEGRGNGWDAKALEYALADVYPERNHNEILTSLPGCVSDCREYGQAAAILHDSLEIRSVRLHTNNPSKVAALARKFGHARVSAVQVPADMTNPHSLKYLLEKVVLLGHDPQLVGKTPTLELLLVAVRNILEQVPFHNLSLLMGVGSTTSDDLGLCFDRNVHLFRQLEGLGFREARAVGARTRFFSESDENRLKREQDIPIAFNHIILLVKLEGRDYLVDVGNGFPYFMPLAVPTEVGSSSSTVTHSFLQYRVRMVSGDPLIFTMEHLRPRQRFDWKDNYTFCPDDALSIDDIAKVVSAHASDAQFGHMLHSLRINRWSLKGISVVLRDTEARLVHPNGDDDESIQIQSGQELANFVQAHFGASVRSKLDKAAPILLENVKMKTPPTPSLVNLLESYVSICNE
jgi:arylamine N-acetyltransferase